MRHLINILVLVAVNTCLASLAQTVIEKNDNGTTKIIGQYDNEGLQTGTWIVLDSLGQDTVSLCNYLNGKLEGDFFTYYIGNYHGSKFVISQLHNYSDWRSDRYKVVGKYKQDSLDGKYMEYYSSGIIRLEGQYDLGLKVGEHVEFHDNGNKYLKQSYSNGTLHGIWQQFYNTGKLREQRHHEMGVLKSKVIYEWFDNGNAMNSSSFLWINDEKILDGLTAEYFENGNTKISCYYTKGKPDGVWEGFYENGNIKYKMIYENCIYQSYTEYDEEGKIKKGEQ